MSSLIKNNFVSPRWASDDEEESTFTVVESKQQKKSVNHALKEEKEEQPDEVVVNSYPVHPTPSIDIAYFMASIEESEMEIAMEESKLIELKAEQVALALKVKECKQSIDSKKNSYEEKARLFGDLSKRMIGRIIQNTPVQDDLKLNVDTPVFVQSSEFPALKESRYREKVIIKLPTSAATITKAKVQETPVPLAPTEKPYPFIKIGDEYQNMEYLCKGYTFMEGGVKKKCDCQELISLSGKYIAKMVALYPNYVPPVRTYECKKLNQKFLSKKQ